jgi:hypothetical protein
MMDVYKRGGDSMMGRYFTCRVHPLSIGELGGTTVDLESTFRNPQDVSKDGLDALLKFSVRLMPCIATRVASFLFRW